nr:hypothetical protein [Nitrosomonas nitrosa]
MSDIQKLSEAIATPIEKVYRTGGFGLTLLIIGTIFMLTAYFGEKGIISHILLGIGALLVLIIVIFFYFNEMNKLVLAKQHIRENKELVDAVQQTAIEATELALNLQALAFKHADQMAQIIQTVRPLMKNLPVVGKYADSPNLVHAQDLSEAIVDTTQTLNEIVTDIQTALISSDASGLKKYLARLENYKGTVQEILKQTHT